MLSGLNMIIDNTTEGTISTFDFHGYSIRVTLINGDPWFVAADIAHVLGYDHTPHMLRILNEWEMNTVHIVDSIPSRGNPNMTIINEPGLYHCIFNSRRPEVVEFQNWVYTYVLPSIRQFGMYVTPKTRKMLHDDPSRIVELERQLFEYEQKTIELQKANAQLQTRNNRLGCKVGDLTIALDMSSQMEESLQPFVNYLITKIQDRFGLN